MISCDSPRRNLSILATAMGYFRRVSRNDHCKNPGGSAWSNADSNGLRSRQKALTATLTQPSPNLVFVDSDCDPVASVVKTHLS